MGALTSASQTDFDVLKMIDIMSAVRMSKLVPGYGKSCFPFWKIATERKRKGSDSVL